MNIVVRDSYLLFHSLEALRKYQIWVRLSSLDLMGQDILYEPGVILVDDFIGLLCLESLILIHKYLVLAP